MENQWYVYKHIRLDKNEPFYIGIGSTENYARAFSRSIRNDIWKKITGKFPAPKIYRMQITMVKK